MISNDLIERYSYNIPRYTSYPSVPHWNTKLISKSVWYQSLDHHLRLDRGVSLYIHLPFCEKLCTYCGCIKRITTNHHVEQPYADTIITEWNTLLKNLDITPIIREIHLGGGTPTFFSPKVLIRMLKGMINHQMVVPGASMGFEAHPSSTRFEHLISLRDFGFDRVSIGVQDISPIVLKAINREQSNEQIEKVTFYARALGYKSVNYDLIYGLPFQTAGHMHATMEYVTKLRPDRIALYRYAHVPWKSKGQRVFNENDFLKDYEKYLLREIADQKLITNGYINIGMDHYALPHDELAQAKIQGNLQRNFMGYSIHRNEITLGLGSSAISSTPDMYIQNHKTVEDYQQSVNNNIWPIGLGHILSAEDQMVKAAIHKLMTMGCLKWQKGSALDRLIQNRISIWKQCMADGLCILEDEKIIITPKGSFFIRNICSYLDPYIQNEQNTKIRFSNAI
ncbi:MAG TPA: oxygen-independent coproporphyrinogen III oxidase [Saprospiraceae bacterium]|nr:oxygen-independent coproporphyrinogen III oxidase [Saprospiraceae bacterium]